NGAHNSGAAKSPIARTRPDTVMDEIIPCFHKQLGDPNCNKFVRPGGALAARLVNSRIMPSRSVNKVILIGHLGRDAETAYPASQVAVTKFSVATNRRWKDQQTG